MPANVPTNAEFEELSERVENLEEANADLLERVEALEENDTEEPPVDPPVDPPVVVTASIFSNLVPTNLTDADTVPIELGTRFSPSVNGKIHALKFYKGAAANGGTHLGRLWSTAGVKLAEVTYANETASGWQSAALSTPVDVVAGTDYVVSYFAPQGRYSATSGALASPVTAGQLVAKRGRYLYGANGGYPVNESNANYFADVEFEATGATTPTNPTTGILNLPRKPWYGGPSYYQQFSKAVAAGWTNPAFFPIAVYFGKPSHAGQLKAAGINTYLGAEHDGSAITSITGLGVSVIAQLEWTSAEVGSTAGVVGWHTDDEIEMNGSYPTDAARLAQHKADVASARAKNDGRFINTNYGNGVLETFWAPGTMPQYVAVDDLTSVDKYAYTSPAVNYEFNRSDAFLSTGKAAASAGAYGWQQDQMEKFSNHTKPNWVFVETAKPILIESGAKVITGAQIEGAVWNSIIHGAAGVLYFQHSNDGSGTYSLITGPNIAKVTAVNAAVQALAPVLNTQSYVWNFGAGLDTMLKVKDGSAYIFAMTDGSTGSKTFTLPAGVTGTTVEVLGESRTLTVTGGKFTDTFASEATHHNYKITL